jgi:hypothetical protein
MQAIVLRMDWGKEAIVVFFAYISEDYFVVKRQYQVQGEVESQVYELGAIRYCVF